LLHIRGGEAVARLVAQRRLLITSQELRRIAKLLLDLPPIATAQVYTELRVEVLNQSAEVQARPEMAVAPNKDFDRIVDHLRGIAQRALTTGSPAPVPSH
jgi:hypothetical protein